VTEDFAGTPPARSTYLVRLDYGMGALWWRIRASAPEEITDAFAEVEVVDDAATIAWSESADLGEMDIETAISGPLASLHAKRQRQRRYPDFGRLLGKDRVYLRVPDSRDNGGEWLTEHGPDGRRFRQVEVRADGSVLTRDEADYPFNPLWDLGEPALAAYEIDQDEFERIWIMGTPDPS
jgi:hypothetical protein